MELIRIGLIGAGSNTRSRHIPGFQEIEGVQIETVCNRTEESSTEVAKAFNIPRISQSWKEVVEDPEIDAVCVGTWPYLHADASIAALKNGKHVLCEARMAMHRQEAESMLETSQKHPDQVAQIVPSPFTLEWDGLIRESLESGELGALREIRVVHTGGQSAREDTPLNWRQHFEYSGINMLSLGIFHEAVQRWIPEDLKWLRADAAVFHEYRLDPETERPHHVRIPESLSVSGEYPNRARLIYHFSSVESGKPEMQMRLNGEKGSYRLDVGENQLYWAEAGQTEETELSPPENAVGWNVEADFIASIREGKPVERTSFSDGVRYMKFTQRVFDSITADGSKS